MPHVSSASCEPTLQPFALLHHACPQLSCAGDRGDDKPDAVVALLSAIARVLPALAWVMPTMLAGQAAVCAVAGIRAVEFAVDIRPLTRSSDASVAQAANAAGAAAVQLLCAAVTSQLTAGE